MRIAVPYENGNVFQHFGKTKAFKLYEVENDQVVSNEVVECKVSGHGAISAELTDLGVDIVICGGLGEGMQMNLDAAGIAIVPGAEGDADAAVEAFLNDELEAVGGGCGSSSDSGCGGSCGSCGGGCGGSFKPPFDGPNVGKTVRAHYKGTLNDGTQFDSSYDRGEPLEFTCGAGMMILGFDEAVATMEVGEIRDVHLTPDKAYGMPDPRAILTLEISKTPGSEDLNIGDRIALTNPVGQQFPVTVIEKNETLITFDANHEMAGKELNFTIELVEVL